LLLVGELEERILERRGYGADPRDAHAVERELTLELGLIEAALDQRVDGLAEDGRLPDAGELARELQGPCDLRGRDLEPPSAGGVSSGSDRSRSGVPSAMRRES